ncbi:MAG TPA: GDSL-type esterase/lipase family protein [Candidatus Binatia bacterium]|nr:GDSL-type esterase/lipase family protein [Candidatus Binatia bacterium]
MTTKKKPGRPERRRRGERPTLAAPVAAPARPGIALAKNLLLAVGSLVLFLVVTEGLARLRYTPARIRYEGVFEYDRDKVYALKRNVTGTFAGRTVMTNSLGQRDREIPVAKPGNGFRVLAVGDSVTFGHGVAVDDTWPERLERRLAARFPERRVEVVNTAVPGNSPFQEYVDLERALVLAPDAAIIQFVLNDVVEPYKVFRRYGGKGKDYHGVEDLPYWDWVLTQRSALYLLLKDVAARLRFGAWSAEGVREKAVVKETELAWTAGADEPREPKVQEAWRECLAWMQREVDLCKRRRMPVVLLVTPVAFQFEDETRTYAQRRLAEFAAANGIAYVDLLPVLRERAVRELASRAPEDAGLDARAVAARHPEAWKAEWRRYFLDHDHFTPAGHELVAEVLAPLLEPVAPSARSAGR